MGTVSLLGSVTSAWHSEPFLPYANPKHVRGLGPDDPDATPHVGLKVMDFFWGDPLVPPI